MRPTPEQQLAFDALLAQARRFAGAGADRLESGLRAIWQTAEDRDAMLLAVAEDVRQLRARHARECDEADEDPGPS